MGPVRGRPADCRASGRGVAHPRRWEAALQADTTATIGTHVPRFPRGRRRTDHRGRTHERSGDRRRVVVRTHGRSHCPRTVGPPIDSPRNYRRLDSRSRDTWRGPYATGPELEIEGLLLRGAFDLVTALELLLEADCADFLSAPALGLPKGSIVIGGPERVICRSAAIEPRRGVRRSEWRRGPRRGGRGTAWDPARRSGVRRAEYAGPRRVYSRLGVRTRLSGSRRGRLHGLRRLDNKSHDGFVGHSVLGPWVNLGAGTITSNLKNTYGSVRLDVRGARTRNRPPQPWHLVRGPCENRDRHDALYRHGSLRRCERVWGAAAQYVPPFAWGSDGTKRLSEEGFLRVAERVLGRRNVSSRPRSGARSSRHTSEGRPRDDALRFGVGLARELLRR